MYLMAVGELTRPILISARVSSVVFFFFYCNLAGEAREMKRERKRAIDGVLQVLLGLNPGCVTSFFWSEIQRIALKS